VLLAFVAVTSISAVIFVYKIRSGTDIRSATILFLLWLGILIGALIAIVWITGERPHWRWGE